MQRCQLTGRYCYFCLLDSHTEDVSVTLKHLPLLASTKTYLFTSEYIYRLSLSIHNHRCYSKTPVAEPHQSRAPRYHSEEKHHKKDLRETTKTSVAIGSTEIPKARRKRCPSATNPTWRCRMRYVANCANRDRRWYGKSFVPASYYCVLHCVEVVSCYVRRFRIPFIKCISCRPWWKLKLSPNNLGRREPETQQSVPVIGGARLRTK